MVCLMDADEAVRHLNNELKEHTDRRARLSQQIEQETLRLGAVAALLKKRYNQSQSASASVADMSAAYMGELIARAQDAEVQASDPIRSVAWISGSKAADYVRRRHASVDRIIASFADYDTLYMSGEHPQALIPAGYARPPHMMWHLDDPNEWIGIDNVQVGYGGTGPGYAYDALKSLGIDETLIRKIAYSRVSDVNPRQPDSGEHSDHWPKFNVPGIQITSAGWVYSTLAGEGRAERVRSRADSDGFYPDKPADTPLQRWLSLLDGADCPQWAKGNRVARVYLDSQSAPRSIGSRLRRFELIIEQGDLQLWIPAFPPRDQTQWLSEEVYESLLAADVYPGELAAKDARGAFWRWVDSQVLNKRRPLMVNIGGELRHDPAAVKI